MKKHLVISGRVQGVGFRYWLQSIAIKKKIFGWVKNNISGNVETLIIGEEQEVKEALLAYTFLLLECDKNYDEEGLDDRIEGWLLDSFGCDIDFEVDDALDKLDRMEESEIMKILNS